MNPGSSITVHFIMDTVVFPYNHPLFKPFHSGQSVLTLLDTFYCSHLDKFWIFHKSEKIINVIEGDPDFVSQPQKKRQVIGKSKPVFR